MEGELAADAAIGAEALDLAVGRVGLVAPRRRAPTRASGRRSGRPGRTRRRRRRCSGPSGRRSRRRSSRGAPRPAMPITSLTWTSRQARTQRLHWMQASSWTAIAGWLRSGGGGVARAGTGSASTPDRGRPSARTSSRGRGPRRAAAGRRAAARRPSAAGRSARGESVVDLHARRRLADARGGQHALALDLDHAGPAVAVGPIARRRRVAEVGDRRSPAAAATCQIVSPGPATTSRPSSSKVTVCERVPCIGDPLNSMALHDPERATTDAIRSDS